MASTTTAKEKHRTKKNLTLAISAAFVCAAAIFVWLCSTTTAPDVRFDSESVRKIDSVWTASFGDRKYPVSLPVSLKAATGRPVTFSTTLTAGDSLNNSLMFRAYHQYVQVFLDGEPLGDFGYGQTTPFGNEPYNGWVLLRLPEDWQGKTLSIVQTPYYDEYAGRLGEVYMGTKNALVFMVIRQIFPILIFNFSVILISLFLLSGSFFFHPSRFVYQLRYMSLFATITGAWLILESGGYQLFLGYAPLTANLIFILFTLLPITLIRFLLSYESFEDSRFMKLLFRLSIANFAVVHLLQIAGLLSYLRGITGVHLLLLLVIVGIAARCLYFLARRIPLADGYLYVSCLVFGAFSCVDIFRFHLGNPASNAATFSQAGFLLFFLILSYFAVKQIFADNENRIKETFLKHLAFTDLLTNLPNRNAFEREVESLRAEDCPTHPFIVMADLNGLKQINDTLGHKAGDEAIIRTGQILNRFLFPSAKVFRIGGDEFCALSRDLDMERGAALIAAIQDELQLLSRDEDIPLSVAVGFWKEAGEGVDEAFKKADSLMYRQKEEMKTAARTAEPR